MFRKGLKILLIALTSIIAVVLLALGAAYGVFLHYYGKLDYSVPPTDFTFTSSSTTVATVGEHTGTIAGASAGSAEITVAYTVGSTTYTDYVNVTVTA